MIHLLWTGGWDSTFRLLQLAYEGTEIQPHYIQEKTRDSLQKEMQAMNKIRQKVNEKFPGSFVHEVELINQSEIIVFPEFTQSHKRLLSKEWVGSQYIYIASYCKQKNLHSLELSIEKISDSQRNVMPCLRKTEIDSENRRVIAEGSDEDLLCLFNQFSFPVLHLTKLDMLKESENMGVAEILNMTWFCHQPLFDEPCGSCNPCISTLEEGLKYRFSRLAIARYEIKKLIISHPELHRFLKRLKYGSTDYASY
ncbi:7-cyano-7-deazaguanine synthase [Marinobacter piscensis]|uniref:7-cyano-7-deazaguanine synthase n=1 Tax=Marinobacter piscensis TaxID=1562308 RepID=UPI0016424690|nr:7-cyano-7-deazaguanine synthase [Marinobacter piscensis]